MATGPGHMASEWVGLLQGLATWHQGSWDGNRTWSHDTREAWMASGSGHMSPRWLGWQQCLATCHHGCWDGYSAPPYGTRVAGMKTRPCQMSPGRLRCNRVWPNGTREATIATGSGHMAPG